MFNLWRFFFSPISFCESMRFWDIGSALSIGGSLLGGAMGDNAAGDAAAASSKATAASNAMLQKQANDNTAAYKPYSDAGLASLNKLSYYLGTANKEGRTDKYTRDDFLQSYKSALSGMDYSARHQNEMANVRADEAYALYQKNPSAFNGWTAYGKSNGGLRELKDTAPLDTSDGNYGSLLSKFSQDDLNKDVVYNSGLQFGLDQGIMGLNRQAAASGSLNSGATLKALTKYANDYGTTKASGAYDRFNNDKTNIYNMLSGQSSQGLNATSGLASNNSNLMTGQANNTMANGTNQGNAAIASGAAWGNAINGGIGNYLYNQRTTSTAPIAGNSTYGGGVNQSAGSVPWYA